MPLIVPTIVGLRDRALLGLMVYSFVRIGAVTGMKVEDVYLQSRRLWVRLHEKGGKRHEMPCHHNLEEYLHAYIDAAGIAEDTKGPLFRTIDRSTKELSRRPLPQANAYAMVQRRALAADIGTKIGNPRSARRVSPPTSRMAAPSLSGHIARTVIGMATP